MQTKIDSFPGKNKPRGVKMEGDGTYVGSGELSKSRW